MSPPRATVRSLDATSHPQPYQGRDTEMRNLILSAAVALVAAASFAAPSEAGYYSYGYKQHCVVKKVKSYDYYGNLVVKRVRVCR